MNRIYRRYDDKCKRRIADGKKIPHRHNSDMSHAKAPKSSELKLAISQRLRAAFEAYGLKQAEMARQLEIDPRQLNGYLTGKNFPDEAIIVRFCDLTGCTSDWIYRGVLEARMPTETMIHITLEYPHLVDRAKNTRQDDRALSNA